MSLFDDFEKLINEHGSANIFRERLLLAEDKYSALEKKAGELKTENKILQKQLEESRQEIENLRNHIVLQEESKPQTTVFSEADIRATLESWFKNLDMKKALSVITFVKVDEELRLPLGSSKRYLRSTVEKLVLWGFPIETRTEGDSTILFVRGTPQQQRVVFGRRR